MLQIGIHNNYRITSSIIHARKHGILFTKIS